MKIHIVHPDVEKFIRSLLPATIAKVLRTIDLLERFGHRLGMPHSKKISKDIFELRIRGQQEIRIFYTVIHSQAFLLHGFVKKSQQIPHKELVVVQRRRDTLDKI
jgi:phage-related protein